MSQLDRPGGVLRALVGLLLFALYFATPGSARAEPPEDDAAAMRPTLREPIEAEPLGSALVVDLATAVGVTEARAVVSFGVQLSGAFDDLFVPPRSAVGRALAKSAGPEPSPSGPTVDEARGEAPEPRVPMIDGALARRAVREALAAARAGEHAAALDDLTTRARASGAVPEVRLRVARMVDEGQTLSPTEYDPDRVTATGGSSLWLEGRLTFQLDRLVFASDEIAIERLRLERARQERELVRDVLEALAAYERARATAADESAEAPARERAELDAAVLEARLDVMTDGWFTSRRAR